MKLLEFLSEQNENNLYTFTIANCVKESEHIKTTVYKQTPLNSIWEWMKGNIPNKYIVINVNHPPIDITGNWVKAYNKGWLKNCIITTEEDLILNYGEEQGKQMVEYYDRKVRDEKD